MPKTTPPLGRQAQKTRLAREKILGAAIGLIREGGFGNATSSRISERAGMTWGAAQHHFGSKEEILAAIMELSHERFTALMAAPTLRRGSLERRVGLFVDRMWQHYQDDLYLAAVEILLAARGTQERPSSLWEQRQARGHLQTLREIFHELRLSDARLLEALVFVHAFLTGLTIERVFESRPRHLPRHLRRIKGVMLGMLQIA